MKIQRKSLFLFWAWMDLFSSCNSYGGILPTAASPFYDDLLAYLQLLHTWGSAAVWLYPLNVLLIISIPLSMIFFSARAAMRCGWPGGRRRSGCCSCSLRYCWACG